jgi:hypothetical protein
MMRKEYSRGRYSMTGQYSQGPRVCNHRVCGVKTDIAIFEIKIVQWPSDVMVNLKPSWNTGKQRSSFNILVFRHGLYTYYTLVSRAQDHTHRCVFRMPRKWSNVKNDYERDEVDPVTLTIDFICNKYIFKIHRRMVSVPEVPTARVCI